MNTTRLIVTAVVLGVAFIVVTLALSLWPSHDDVIDAGPRDVSVSLVRDDSQHQAAVRVAEVGRWLSEQTTTTTRPAPKARTAPKEVRVRAVGDVWHALAMCETGGKMDNPNTGNGYYGYYQFDLATWREVGESGYPHHYSYEHQREAAQRLQAKSGWGRWPLCSRKLGLR